jgi:hypothetical protein
MSEVSPKLLDSHTTFSQVVEKPPRKPAVSSCVRRVPVRVPFPKDDRKAIYQAWRDLGKSVRWLARVNSVSEACIESIIREFISEREAKLSGQRALVLRAGAVA